MKNIVILGAGDLGKCVAAYIEDINKIEPTYNILGYLDMPERVGETLYGYKVIGTDDDLMTLYRQKNVCAVTTNQDGRIRRHIVEKFPEFDGWETIIHPRAILLGNAKIGAGSIICPNATVGIDTTVGTHCLISVASNVGHDDTIGDYTSIMPGAILCGHVNVGAYSYVATGASIVPGMNVGENTCIGVGSVVIEDIPSNVTASGNPCKPVMKRKMK